MDADAVAILSSYVVAIVAIIAWYTRMRYYDKYLKRKRRDEKTITRTKRSESQ